MKVTNNGKSNVGFGGTHTPDGIVGSFTLEPGENEVDSKAWETARKNAAFKSYLDAGTLVESGNGGKKPEKEKPVEKATDAIVAQFARLSVSKAIDAVEKASDVEVLEACLAAESRASVTEAIEARLEELKS